MEIKNIVFDIGNVLLRWDPEKIFTAIFNRNDFYMHPLSTIVGGEIWLELDQGLLTLEEGIEKSVSGNEAFRIEIEKFFKKAPYYFMPMESSVELALMYKRMGYRIYLLSNFHKYGYGVLRQRFPFFDSFDGGVISWEVRLNKPDRRIYETLLSKYKLDPCQTVFIDDTKDNISAAESLGIKGIHYTPDINLKIELERVILEGENSFTL